MVADGYRADRFDVTGALICLAGVAFIMSATRRVLARQPAGTLPGLGDLRLLCGVLALLLVAFSLGLSNFAAAIGIGVAGTGARTRLRVGIVFGLFEAGMPILGLVLGRGLASTLGSAAHWIGAVLLIATGGYALIQALRGSGEEAPAPPEGGIGRLLVTGIALSIDNLAVGFALGTYHVNLAVAALVIGAVSVALSLIGLELGAKIGTRTGQRGELLGGLILIAVGIAVATRVI